LETHRKLYAKIDPLGEAIFRFVIIMEMAKTKIVQHSTFRRRRRSFVYEGNDTIACHDEEDEEEKPVRR